MTLFEQAVEFVLSFEKEMSDHPDDPGGFTKWGISQRAYPGLNLRALTREQAIDIYKRDYWNRCGCDQFPAPIAFLLFDAAVNQGPGNAVRILQRALSVKPDGVIGPVTLEAASKLGGDATAEFAARRAYAYAVNPNLGVFGLGWFRRLLAATKIALALD